MHCLKTFAPHELKNYNISMISSVKEIYWKNSTLFAVVFFGLTPYLPSVWIGGLYLLHRERRKPKREVRKVLRGGERLEPTRQQRILHGP